MMIGQALRNSSALMTPLDSIHLAPTRGICAGAIPVSRSSFELLWRLLATGDVVLRNACGIVRILRLRPGINGSGLATRIECRARRRSGVSRRLWRIKALTALVGLSGGSGTNQS